MISTDRINAFCLQNALRIAQNPCISPDFCLDWPSLRTRLLREHQPNATMTMCRHAHARIDVARAELQVVEDEHGDHAWIARSRDGSSPLDMLLDGVALSTTVAAFPASWANLLRIKNLLQEHDPLSTVFASAAGGLDKRSIGVGARFTTLHWPAVEWAMAHLGISLTANQNSIPRELVYDVNAMLDQRLMQVPFPFIGTAVPEGHQGQSVEGMSHGAVMSKLKTGFHVRRIPWGFNADHQPIGGVFDSREDRLVDGCLLASYITFDLSPELAVTSVPTNPSAYNQQQVGAALVDKIRARVAAVGVTLEETAFQALLAQVWPAVKKMSIRDKKYAAARAAAFTTAIGRAYVRELSIDELPGLTSPATLATMLALCEALDMPVNFVAPAFGFQKNFPFADHQELERRVSAAWAVCQAFGVSIGFHSGSGKSEENYRLVGRITGSNLEIKTSGRYTYEMGRALAHSTDSRDKELFAAWWAFTRDLATVSAFSSDLTEQGMARQFIRQALELAGHSTEVFASPATLQGALSRLTANPEHMFWFEYNFLYVLAAEGRPTKTALGDHSPAGYRQRARFYAISDAGRLGYLVRVAEYLCFLCDTTGLVDPVRVAAARRRLATYRSPRELLADIAP